MKKNKEQKIIFKKFKYSYYKNKVLEDINIEISEQDRVIITGKNGSGKSTIIKILANLNKVNKKKYSNTFKSTFFLSDKFMPIRNSKVKEFLEDLKEYYKTEFNIERGMLKVKLENIKIKNLSKGNMQKLGLLAALISNQELILIDEVFDGVDQENRLELLELLKESTKTFIIITHEASIFTSFKTKHYHITKGISECLSCI